MIAAFCHVPHVGWKYTVWRPPESLFFELLERGDNYIGYQELAGVVVALWTFSEFMREELVTFWQDNNAVLYTVLAGGGRAAEVNTAVGHLWLRIAELQPNFRIGRVESRANVADGPTRDCYTWVHSLGAVFLRAHIS